MVLGDHGSRFTGKVASQRKGTCCGMGFISRGDMLQPSEHTMQAKGSNTCGDEGRRR